VWTIKKSSNGSRIPPFFSADPCDCPVERLSLTTSFAVVYELAQAARWDFPMNMRRCYRKLTLP
jgi:hypothetical protein